jgi:hypothetical protein
VLVNPVADVDLLTFTFTSLIIIMSPIFTTRNLSWIGLILSAYAVYVEYKVEHLAPDEEFSALCDVPALGASCRYVLYSYCREEGTALLFICINCCRKKEYLSSAQYWCLSITLDNDGCRLFSLHLPIPS